MFKRFFKDDESVKVKMSVKQRLHTAICMLSLTIIALTTATYAWFTPSASTKVRELELNVSAGANLKISTKYLGNNIESYFDEILSINNGDHDGSEIDAWLRDNYSVALADMILSPHTSGNGKDMYLKAANENGGDPSDPNAGTYMEYELWFIAENDMRVHLSTDDDDDGDWTHIESSRDNSSDQANIVYCTRISFECRNDNRTVIWEPNKSYGASTDLKGQAARDDIGTLELPAENAMRYTNETYICTLKANEAKMVTVRVWVEGEDPDCNDEVQKAKFLTWLRFQGTDENNNVIS